MRKSLVVQYYENPSLLLEPPLGRFAYRKWKRMRKKLEYELFSFGGVWGSMEWYRVLKENETLNVWK